MLTFSLVLLGQIREFEEEKQRLNSKLQVLSLTKLVQYHLVPTIVYLLILLLSSLLGGGGESGEYKERQGSD